MLLKPKTEIILISNVCFDIEPDSFYYEDGTNTRNVTRKTFGDKAVPIISEGDPSYVPNGSFILKLIKKDNLDILKKCCDNASVLTCDDLDTGRQYTFNSFELNEPLTYDNKAKSIKVEFTCHTVIS